MWLVDEDSLVAGVAAGSSIVAMGSHPVLQLMPESPVGPPGTFATAIVQA